MAMEIVAESGLTPQEKEFVTYYLLTRNPAEAARKAGITPITGRKWLKRPEIEVLVLECGKQIAQQCELDLHEILNEYKRIALFDHKEIVESAAIIADDGTVTMSVEDFRNIDTRALKTVTYKVDANGMTTITVTPHDKLAALAALERHVKDARDRGTDLPKLTSKDFEGKSAQEVSSAYQQYLAG